MRGEPALMLALDDFVGPTEVCACRSSKKLNTEFGESAEKTKGEDSFAGDLMGRLYGRLLCWRCVI